MIVKLIYHSNCVFSGSPELLYFEALFQPFKERLIEPPLFIMVGRIEYRQMLVVCQESELMFIFFFIIEADDPELLWILFSDRNSVSFTSESVRMFFWHSMFLLDCLILQDRYSSHYTNGLCKMYFIMFAKRVIRPVEYIVSIYFK